MICKFCNDRGCLACDGERKKKERMEREYQASRKARLASQTPEEILSSLPAARLGVQIAAGITFSTISAEEVEILARETISKDLEDGGHEFPEPTAIFTCDGSPEQMEEMIKLFHLDRFSQASKTDGGMAAIADEAKKVMERRLS